MTLAEALPKPQALCIVRFANKRARTPQTENTTWQDFAQTLCAAAPARIGKDGPLFSPTIYAKGSTRGDAGVQALTAVVLDFDDGATPAQVLARIGADVECVIYPTFRDHPAHRKFRLVLPLAHPCPVGDWLQLWSAVSALCGDGNDAARKDVSGMYYLPAQPTDETAWLGAHDKTADRERAQALLLVEDWRPGEPLHQHGAILAPTEWLARADALAECGAALSMTPAARTAAGDAPAPEPLGFCDAQLLEAAGFTTLAACRRVLGNPEASEYESWRDCILLPLRNESRFHPDRAAALRAAFDKASGTLGGNEEGNAAQWDATTLPGLNARGIGTFVAVAQAGGWFDWPSAKGRPCFRVLEDWAAHGGDKLRPGVWHFGIKAGKNDAQLFQQWVCSPLHVDAVTTDAHAGNFGRLLRFRTTLGEWRTWAMPMELLRADGADLRGALLSLGMEIDPGAHQLLGRYLQHRVPQRRMRCTLQTGWTNDAFVLPAEVIGPGADDVAYQPGERPSDEYMRNGTLEGWRDGVAALAAGNPVLMLALCAAFAGPLMAKVNADSGGVHLVGDSSTGKTTAIDAACSVWGGESFRRTWRATSNGMEGVAALFNDSLLALDEISECDPREVGAIVYSLGNGRGKQRASRSGAARAIARWRCSVLSSGERTIGTTMAEGGSRQKAGQTVRLLDVPAQRTYGAWDELHGHASGAAFSDAIRNASKAHHGHAGPQFLRELTSGTGTNLAAQLEAIKALPAFAAQDGQATRAAARFAVLALAGELATGYGITTWQPGQATEAAAQCFAAWLAQRGATGGNLERAQVLEKVQGFLDRHGDSRFSSIEFGDTTKHDRAGWWEDTNDGRLYLFTAAGMREALAGFDMKRGLAALQEAGALSVTVARVQRIGGRTARVYAVHAGRLDGNQESAQPESP